MAFKKCPNGMYSELKYDGERVQLHKRGDEFKYYSRSLKPVLPHKVSKLHAVCFIRDTFIRDIVRILKKERDKPLSFLIL